MSNLCSELKKVFVFQIHHLVLIFSLSYFINLDDQAINNPENQQAENLKRQYLMHPNDNCHLSLAKKVCSLN